MQPEPNPGPSAPPEPPVAQVGQPDGAAEHVASGRVVNGALLAGGAPAADGVPDSAVVEEPAPEPTVIDEPAPFQSPARYNPFRYWMRPLVLGVLVLILLGLTYWDQQRVPDRPVAPDVLTATPAAGSTVSASDPGLTDTLARLRTALQRRDARGFANLSDPDGVLVASFGGSLPDGGATTVTDVSRFAQDALNGAEVSLLGWRNDGRGRVVILADGFKPRAVKLSGSSTLEVTSLTGIGLAPRGGTWYVRWVLPDTNGVLAQQARSLVWQPWPTNT